MQIKYLVSSVALIAIQQVGTVTSFPKVGIHNRSPYPGHVVIIYRGCKSDDLKVGAAHLDKKGVVQEASNYAPSARGGCLITGMTIELAGAKDAKIAFSALGSSARDFTIVKSGDGWRIIDRKIP